MGSWPSSLSLISLSLSPMNLALQRQGYTILDVGDFWVPPWRLIGCLCATGLFMRPVRGCTTTSTTTTTTHHILNGKSTEFSWDNSFTVVRHPCFVLVHYQTNKSHNQCNGMTKVLNSCYIYYQYSTVLLLFHIWCNRN